MNGPSACGVDAGVEGSGVGVGVAVGIVAGFSCTVLSEGTALGTGVLVGSTLDVGTGVLSSGISIGDDTGDTVTVGEELTVDDGADGVTAPIANSNTKRPITPYNTYRFLNRRGGDALVRS